MTSVAQCHAACNLGANNSILGKAVLMFHFKHEAAVKISDLTTRCMFESFSGSVLGNLFAYRRSHWPVIPVCGTHMIQIKTICQISNRLHDLPFERVQILLNMILKAPKCTVHYLMINY
jgi:hypothetical protein